MEPQIPSVGEVDGRGTLVRTSVSRHMFTHGYIPQDAKRHLRLEQNKHAMHFEWHQKRWGQGYKSILVHLGLWNNSYLGEGVHTVILHVASGNGMRVIV